MRVCREEKAGINVEAIFNLTVKINKLYTFILSSKSKKCFLSIDDFIFVSMFVTLRTCIKDVTYTNDLKACSVLSSFDVIVSG